MNINDAKTVARSLSIACFAITALLLATAQISATTVGIADVTIEPSSTFTLPITIDDISNYGTGTINIEYDPAVVHVTGVTSSSDSSVTAKNINNTIGLVRISAWNLDGVSGDLIFADITFGAVDIGSTPLNISITTLQDTSYTEITPLTISDGSIEIGSPQPPTPFSVNGYVYYENGTPCNNPIVNITNQNTGKDWMAETSDNYYNITLTAGIDLNESETLRFDATDGMDANVMDHVITAGEIAGGGIFDFNLTLGLIDLAPSLVTYTISNITISPDGDGIEDDTEIDVEFSESVDAAILIENATGVIKTLYTGSGVSDPDPQTWDGIDDIGNTVTCGTYQVNVTMGDGVNPMVYDNSKSITVMVGATTLVSIADLTAEPDDAVTVPIMIHSIDNYGTGTINIEYDSAVVHVTDVTSSSDSSVIAKNIDNTAGLVRISAWNLDGVSGDIIFADVEIKATGNSGDSTQLTITVDTLQDTSYNEISVTVSSGSFTISTDDPPPHLVTYTISNTTISPNGDGIMDDTEIDVEFSESVDAAIRIEDATGVIKTLYTGSCVTDPDPQTWDGIDDIGNTVTCGTYQVNVTMDDGVNPVVYDNTRSITVMAGTTTLIYIPDVSATGMITVPITIENVSNAGSCQLTLNYDPDVVIVSSACHSNFDSLFANLDDAASGSVSILAYQTSNPGLDGDVIVANVTFMAVGKSGSSTPLNLEVTTLTDATPNCNPITYTIRNGGFTMFLNGDVNGDSRVDVADCMFLAKHLLYVSGFETIVEAAADVNGNGEIEASDCMYLAKHLAGIDGFEVLK